MLRGIDGVHTWTSPDAVTLRLNELDDVSTGAPKWPRYRLLDVDHGYPEAGATAHKRIGQAGAVAHPDYRGSRIHTYTIEVMGRTIDELRQAEEDLEAAFYDQSAEGRMDVGTHPLNPDYSAANDRYFNAKAGNLIPGTNAPDSDLSPELGFRREWVIDMRNHEGVYYEELTPDTFKQAVIDMEPSLYWALDSDDGATDLSGNGRDGTAQGSVTIGGGAGLLVASGDSSTDFDGSNDYISSSYSPITSGSEVTIVLLTNRDTGTTNDTLVGTSDATHAVYWRANATNGRQWVAADASAGADVLSFGIAHTVNAADTALLGLLMRSSGGAVKAWGAMDADVEWSDADYSGGSTLLGTDFNSAPGTFQVGTYKSGTDPFDGRISHVAIFPRKLTTAEWAELYLLATSTTRSYY